MLIHPGTQERLIAEAPTSAGSTSKQGSIQSDSLLVSLWVSSISAGSLSVEIFTLTDDDKEVSVIIFPIISSGTTALLLRKSAVSLQRFRVQTTYTGPCDYEIYVRAIEGAGESSARILGSDSLRTDSITIGISPTVLIASSLTDRTGLVIKNWGGIGNLFVSEDSSKLPARAYPMGPKDALALDVSAGVTIYAVSDSGSIDVRIAEAGG